MNGNVLLKFNSSSLLFALFYDFTVRVPQTLGEAMNVEKAEASYENTFENLYGMYYYVIHN